MALRNGWYDASPLRGDVTTPLTKHTKPAHVPVLPIRLTSIDNYDICVFLFILCNIFMGDWRLRMLSKDNKTKERTMGTVFMVGGFTKLAPRLLNVC